MEQILFTKSEAAKLAHVSIRTIERMIARKELGFVRPNGPGGHVRIPRAELERLSAGGSK